MAKKQTLVIISPPRIVVIYDYADIGNTVIHEVGHLISDTHTETNPHFDTINRNELYELYEKYADVIGSYDASARANANQDPREFFAESFRICVTDKMWLTERTDGLTDFISSAIDRYLSERTETEYTDVRQEKVLRQSVCCR